MKVLHYELFLLSCIIALLVIVVFCFTHYGVGRWSSKVRFWLTYSLLKRGWTEGRIDILFYGLSLFVLFGMVAVVFYTQLLLVNQLNAPLLPMIWVWMLVGTAGVAIIVIAIPMWATGTAADKAHYRWVQERS
ncbi:hypothetical protein A2707_04140 [Candidatus Saccharibacteria bacterium RIFCSPHIGHO2_01_FULL_45_15]|nr:MAG: hypothetical protein A2707_04140 [Candidatus Saccharibacteria bacterium RIFCSPHIGHO2_01_FULL_45_15]OGL27134.1 MAG: hypothetical protein A3C39_01040 [Candidatus Saccharibacteria bacterium RIFCSPHIGHO2_02_FULL_46_12]OGL32830.1 MAG: hypothetical protein A3E76_05820 [Candidatus Saccharibacteria bacterium RIFCSPHIGHO2_12_FULL_44_22]